MNSFPHNKHNDIVSAYLLGRGSVLTTDKTVEMDAVIMCGKTLDAGAVGCVQNIRNPIVLARKVKDEV